MRALRTVFLAGCVLAAAGCDSGSSAPPPPGTIAANLGPAGGSLRGPLGTTLGGVEITVPAGALVGFHEVTLASVDPVSVPGALSAGQAFRLVATPEPGFLLRDVVVRCPVNAPGGRSPNDLLLIVGSSTRGGGTQLAPAKATGGLTKDGRFYEAAVRRLGVFQPVVTAVPRRESDAAALVRQGLAELEKGSLRSVDQAGLHFRQALVADPFQNDARLFEPIARLARLLNDRRDRGAKVESFGELLERYGVVLGNKTLVERLLAGDLPTIAVPPTTPGYAATLDFLKNVARPELAAVRAGLLRVADHVETTVDTSRLGYGLGAEREVDFGELAALRAFVDFVDGAIDVFEATNLDIDAAQVSRDAATKSVEQLLAENPAFGRSRASLFDKAAARFEDALAHAIEGYVGIDAERDDQSDDLLVFHRSVTPKRKEELLGSLLELQRSLLTGEGGSFRVARQPGTVTFRLRDFLARGAIDLRALLPAFRGHLATALGSSDPTLGGLLPFMTEDEAVRRASLATRASFQRASIVLDGKADDWPAQSEVLVPTDWRGDVRSPGRVPALDLERVFLATDGTLLYVRIDFADGDPGHDPRYATVYRVLGYDLTRRPNETGRFEVRVDASVDPPEVELRLASGTVAGAVAFGRGMLEAGVPIDGLVGTPRDRVVRVRSAGLDRSRGVQGSDETRPVLVKF